MTVTACKASFQKSKPKEILQKILLKKDYKNFDISTFKNDLWLKLQSIKSCDSFEQVYLEILNKYAPSRKKFLRASYAPYAAQKNEVFH